MLHDCITERKIKDRHEKMNMEPGEPDGQENDGDNVQINVNSSHTENNQSLLPAIISTRTATKKSQKHVRS